MREKDRLDIRRESSQTQGCQSMALVTGVKLKAACLLFANRKQRNIAKDVVRQRLIEAYTIRANHRSRISAVHRIVVWLNNVFCNNKSLKRGSQLWLHPQKLQPYRNAPRFPQYCLPHSRFQVALRAILHEPEAVHYLRLKGR